jgi:hypothetical protein
MYFAGYYNEKPTVFMNDGMGFIHVMNWKSIDTIVKAAKAASKFNYYIELDRLRKENPQQLRWGTTHKKSDL